MRLIEIYICLFIFLATSFLYINHNRKNLMSNKAYYIKNEITDIIDLSRKTAISNGKIEVIHFNLDNKKINYLDKYLDLDNSFVYDSKNKSNNFVRIINENGNFNKGFTINILDSEGRVYQSIVYSNNNGLLLPVQKND